MTNLAVPVALKPGNRRRPDLDRRAHPIVRVAIAAIIGAALSFVAYSIYAGGAKQNRCDSILLTRAKSR